jgi:hypothetical protein
MVLILGKCYNDGISRNGFKYGKKGDVVTAPDWNPEPKCGNGLHGLKQGNGAWNLLEGSDWLVIHAFQKDVIDIDQYKCKFRTGKILYRGNSKGLHQYAYSMATDSYSAFQWAKNIGNREIMRDHITESKWAYCWALTFGDKEIMRDHVTDSQHAFYWAVNFGDQEIMRDRVTESLWAYYWASEIGNREIMRERITELKWIEEFNKLPS